MTINVENPYRGPFSFKEDDEGIFFGRNSEVEELINLIRKHQLTVLYGASGTGKTSLIHAKLLPQLKREYFHPIYIRVNFANKDEDPLAFTQKRIVEELRIWDENIPEFVDNQSLIDYAAKNVIFKGLIKPVLFFDQFEELFTLGHKIDPFRIHRFMFQLSELIELRLPDILKTVDYINNISSFKVVFSLRQDWIGFFDDFTQLIPSINEVRYRLKRFSPGQALDAIICPSPNISRETAELIIKKIGTPALWREDAIISADFDKDLINKEVDPFVLSLYCYQLFNKSRQKQLTEITSQFVQEHDDIKLIRNYYEESIEKYVEVRHLIENKLLNESGKRLIIPLDKFTGKDETLREITSEISKNTGIIRIVGIGTESEVEIVHDRLAKQIFESKNERITKEIHDEASKKEREANSLKKSAKKAKKVTLAVGIIAILIILSLTIFAFKIYINFKNDNEAQGLRRQLDFERIKSTKAKDSISTLNDLINNQSPRIDTIEHKILTDNEKIVKDKYAIIIKQQKKSLDSLILKVKSLETNWLTQKNLNDDLKNELSLKNNIIDSYEQKNTNKSSNISNSKVYIKQQFEKTDFTNFKILNIHNPDSSVNYQNIKKFGYKLSFNIPAILETEKGSIRFKIYFDEDHSSIDQISLQTLKLQRMTKSFTIKLNQKSDLINNGIARYKITYVDNKGIDKFPILEGEFRVSKGVN